MRKEWFAEWFNSPYYDILYQSRDSKEAEHFIDNLLIHLKPVSDARFLDLACGKGRYARYIASKNYEVVGLDLSEESIKYAQQFETNALTFFKHDMRFPYRINYFDYIFNFFTSFGYFKNEAENLRTLRSIASGLNQNGILVLDYFNSPKIIANLVPKETKTVENIVFEIKRRIKSDFVEKTIVFFDEMQQKKRYTEQVRLFTLAHFEKMISDAGLVLVQTFGDYALTPYNEKTSNRLILIIKQKK